AAAAEDVRGTAFVATEAPEAATSGDARTLAQRVCDHIDPARPAVVAVTLRSGGKASLVVAVNAAARQHGLSAPAPVKGAPPGRWQPAARPGWRRARRGGARAAGGGAARAAVTTGTG